MTRWIGFLCGLLLAIANAIPAQAIELFADGTWQAVNWQSTPYSGAYVDLGKGNIAMTFDADSLRTLFSNLTSWAGNLCGIPVSVLSATQNTFTGKFAKGKAKGTIRFSFVGIAMDGSLGTATWTGKYKGGFAPTSP